MRLNFFLFIASRHLCLICGPWPREWYFWILGGLQRPTLRTPSFRPMSRYSPWLSSAWEQYPVPQPEKSWQRPPRYRHWTPENKKMGVGVHNTSRTLREIRIKVPFWSSLSKFVKHTRATRFQPAIRFSSWDFLQAPSRRHLPKNWSALISHMYFALYFTCDHWK